MTSVTSPAPGRPETAVRMPRGLVLLLATTCGAAVANLYYVQPLLNVIGKDLGAGHSATALLVACCQVGYVLGLVFLVPVGDLRERRRLLTVTLLLAAVAAVACALAPTFALLGVALVTIGVLAVVAQITVPMASALAAPEERGAVVGMVMSGLLIGILGARTVAGLVAEAGGWRLPFVVAAGMMVVLAGLIAWRLPEVPPTEDASYRHALRSVAQLIGREPLLRQRMALGALHFAGFSTLWTTISFLLGGAPYDYGEATIGLFGLAGLAGALMAPLSGKLADRGHGRAVQWTMLTLLLASWGILLAGKSSLVALIAGVVVLDLAVQGTQINNQSAIYSLSDAARSRLTTAYMTSVFLGGTAGSIVAGLVYGAGGWRASCALGAGFAAMGLAVWAATQRVGRH